ncbi:NAD(P)-dependent dehydrogenase (short-subunit alcohol dehydrogenase family) [Pseudomonas sp. OG7]|jgi:NAD(P)-dependent dehydrogenase (short-subunit alcohol dehydrogenase family)|uniref:SDR family NAD(P)-dependent oxidoreductase n=1 Tax=Pseudomonas sp. OG7 TaxID=2587037 RepID=UPI0016186B1F|nr:SDR family NAD(P)-dependent oxidoreductase [Pseudomonas sp. OG7]MBB3273894.1 NAD(P)-dependent dehydrogenase (short-subunit alcohol dehydrogenase family) [Pseudomonas sp. OG7]
MDLKNTAVLVTGGASGLGEATARHLASKGARVAILDIQLERAELLASEIGGIAVRCDVTDPASATEAIAQAREAHGVARLLVNCAGGGAARRVVGKNGPMALEDFTKVINLNLVGTFNIIRLAAADMIAAEPDAQGERGVILITTSVAAFEGQIGQAAYTAAKGGLASLTIQLAREFAQFGVRAMAVAPGIFETPLMDNASPELRNALSDAIPFPSRLGDPKEFAELIAHIAENRYLNGDVIRLDGAVRLTPR